MKTLLRMTVAAVVAVACSLPSPQPLAAQVPEPTEKLASHWQVIVRPRGGFLAPKWQYSEGRSLPKRPTAGIEVLMRPAFSWYGGRLLLERTAEWNEGPGMFSRPGDQGIESYQSVIADFILYPTWSLEGLPYLFAGGGFRTYATEDSEVITFPLPFFAGERRAALHAGVGFEVPVKKFLVNLEIADYYGEIMNFGRVHDLHTSLIVGYTGFGALFRKLFQDRSEELLPPEEDRR